jgi:transcriptional regulator with AAA-type ATPase domain/predicted ATPase
MAALRGQIRHLVTFDTLGSALVPTLLLQGETGTGKSLVARIMHDSGPRAAGPFVDVNCAAIPDTMLEAELFGFEAGAFTDARHAKPGLFEAAAGGTLFLDEIEAVPLALQGKLLTALETKQVRRLGAVRANTVDVKLIAATNAGLPEAVAAGRFRADLYHRLAVVELTLPPLRQRGADVAELAQAYVQHYSAAHGVPPKRLTATAVAWLQSYAWPGNVRELSHLMQRVTLLHVGEEIETETLTQLCRPLPLATADAPMTPAPQDEEVSPTSLAEVDQIRQALAQTGGNVARAARLLGISRDMLRYRMQRYGIARLALDAQAPPGAAPSAPLVPLASAGERPTRIPRRRARREEAPSAVPVASPTQTHSQQEREPSTATEGAQRDVGEDPVVAEDTPPMGPAWAQKPVVVLALELTWLERPEVWPLSYDPWTLAARWEQAAMDTVQGFGGVLLHRTPVSLTWVFGLPQALEQMPQRAVHSALALRQMVAAAQAPDLGPCPTVRLAVHLGIVQVQHPGQVPPARVLAVGDTLALPMRLLGQAGPGEVVISPEVGRLVESWVALEPRRLQLHAGDPVSLRGYAVVGARPGHPSLTPGEEQRLSPFVGRTREVTLVEAVWARVQAGQGQVVGLVGAPGMGKSRFLLELRQCFTALGIPYCEGQCLAYRSATPYQPILGLLRDYCGLSEGDRPEALRAKVHRALEASGSDAEAGAPWLLDLLGIPAETDRLAAFSADVRRRRTFETLAQLFLASSQRQPLVLAVENLHWIDPTSEELLALLIEQMAGVPLLVLTTTRPGHRTPWMDRSYATQLVLPPLDPAASRQVVRHRLAHQALTPALEQQLLAKAEGNPFFLEELAHTVREQEEYQQAPGVPDTIQVVLAARLDRLPAIEKRLVQAAAVIGEDVVLPLLQALVAVPEATLHSGLAHLQEAELFFPKSFVPMLTYTFKHVLIQDAAYQSLLKSTRQQFHQQIAQVLEARFPALVETQPELVAQHYTAAGGAEQAIPYWQRAGQLASDRSAHLEAISHVTTGIELLTTLPETPELLQQSLRLHIALGAALLVTKGNAAPEVEHAYLRARELCQHVGETPELFQALFGLWRFYAVQPQLHTAREMGEALLHLAQGTDDPAPSIIAHYAFGFTWGSLGMLLASHTHLEEGIARYTPDQRRAPMFRTGQDLGVGCRVYVARTLWLLGYPEQALTRVHEARTLAHELAHPYSLASARCWVITVYQFCRDVPAVHEHAEAAVTLATEQGYPHWIAHGTSVHGWALALQGQSEEGLAHVLQGIAAWGATEAVMLLPYFYTVLADVYDHRGHTAEGLQALAEAYTLIEQYEERWWEAEVCRLRGVLLLWQAVPQPEEAGACFQRALEVARRQQAKSLELRAAMSLARLWQQQDRRAEAHELLAPVYGWFTEGFDTADLQEAKALLEELGTAG